MMQYYNFEVMGNFFEKFMSRFLCSFMTLLRRICHTRGDRKKHAPKLVYFLMFLSTVTSSFANPAETRVATFNVSMEGENYGHKDSQAENILATLLSEGTHPQIRNIAAIIQRTRPDIILLNEFDYIADPRLGVELFINSFLKRSQHGEEAIDYPYYYLAPVNTGLPSPYDLDRDGVASGKGNDAWGFGHYPGQYGMVLLSRFPIDTSAVRTFQHFRWADLPGAEQPMLSDDEPFFAPEVWQSLRLSSKSHWDIPVIVDEQIVHVLASHPTPPVFDGPERRNALRNRDEIRFWLQYIDGSNGSTLYDDAGVTGGLAQGTRFVIVGDLNASASEGDSIAGGIDALLASPKIQESIVPSSIGAAEHRPEHPKASEHTALWGLRADYVLPSVAGFANSAAGVFWPSRAAPEAYLVQDRAASSDHRLVWVDLRILPIP